MQASNGEVQSANEELQSINEELETSKEDVTDRARAEDALRRSHDDLRSHAEELTRFNRVAVDRELRMIELKKDINELRQRLADLPPYPLEFERQG